MITPPASSPLPRIANPALAQTPEFAWEFLRENPQREKEHGFRIRQVDDALHAKHSSSKEPKKRRAATKSGEKKNGQEISEMMQMQ